MEREAVKVWVCSACNARHFAEVALARGKCPTCNGAGAVKTVYRDDAGVLHDRKSD